jgi:hypothetical protein
MWYGAGPDSSANYRYISFDGATVNGYRYTNLYGANYLGSSVWNTPAFLGLCHLANTNYTWEDVANFDLCCKGSYDIGDGNGPSFWAVYQGSYEPNPTDNTLAGMGIAHLGMATIDSVVPMIGSRLINAGPVGPEVIRGIR